MRRSLLNFSLASAVVIGAGIAAGPLMSQVEQPAYTIIRSDGAIEIRAYGPMIMAETKVEGDRKTGIGAGFRAIAGYIFGGNAEARKIAMTAPVIQQADASGWRVRFVMPRAATMETLPHPNDPHVTLEAVPATTFAAIRFSGLASDDAIARQTGILMAYIKQNKLDAVGSPILAFFDPPWTLPFFRRNEVMIALKRIP